MHPVRPMLLAAAAALVVLPSLVEAQRVIVRRGPAVVERHEQPRRLRDREPARRVTLAVGTFDYARADDDAPMAALRTDWRLTPWLRSELGAAYAMAEVPGPLDGGEAGEIDAHLLNATVGLTAELPWPVVRPYVGIAGGLFARLNDGDIDDFVRPSVAVPVGVRIPFTRTLGLRAEVRWRWDEHPDGTSAPSREHTVGLSLGY